jgi:hypothetical protein
VPTTFFATIHKGLVAAVVLLVIGVTVALAQTSHTKPAAQGIDFRRVKTLAWSVELDSDSPDALHDVICTHVGSDRYDCVGNDASGRTRTMHIRVSHSGTAWQTIDDDVDR